MILEPLPWLEPAAVFRACASAPGLVWLDSNGTVTPRARWSYLAAFPARTLTVDGFGAALDDVAIGGDALDHVRAELRRMGRHREADPVPFTGGAIGYIGYDFARGLTPPERDGLASDRPALPLLSRHPRSGAMPDLRIGFYDLLIAWDRARHRVWLVDGGRDPSAARDLRRRLALASGPGPGPAMPVLHWRAELTRSDYEARVDALIDHIRAGDLYQANFTGRHLAARPAALDTVALYQALRAASPAPFSAYLDAGAGRALLSVSPERFLSLDADGVVESRPIKGTRPRGNDPEDDRAQAQALLASPKDRAENLMIVDLMRHDLGRVAAIGSVAVPELCAIESFAQVHHLVSSVRARLAPGADAIDLLRASLPGGSVTGAPKRRALELIDMLEVARRGAYCGTVLRIGTDGALDSSIVIRTLVADDDQLVAQAGGGIVADSDPAAEYDEMLAKLGPLLLGRR